MIFFWIIYFIISIAISFLFSTLVNRRILKIFIFSFFMAVSFTIWFKSPGDNSLSPVFSILILEATIIDNNGWGRLLRPLGIVFLLTFFLTAFFWKKETKN